MSTCKPDEDIPVTGEYRLGPKGEAYIKFTPGSYWIYENDKSKELDTITMQWYYSKMINLKGERNSFSREDIDLKMGPYIFDLQHPYPDATPSPLPHVFVFHTQKGPSRSGIFFYPFDTNLQGGNSGQVTKLNQLHDSLKIQDQWYYDVAEFEADIDYIWDERRTKYFWAKNIGLVKREKYMNFTEEYIEGWELIDFDVSQ
ncbi:MAG: hypothetical protein COA58_00955 [Bacteroidetes bacterium]|nr:MAG: hypothetical protein COA58_00955 [Bacteroidota bacterium]